eukprot:TCONS_00001646-protein
MLGAATRGKPRKPPSSALLTALKKISQVQKIRKKPKVEEIEDNTPIVNLKDKTDEDTSNTRNDDLKTPPALVTGDASTKEEHQKDKSDDQNALFRAPGGPYYKYSPDNKMRLNELMRQNDLTWGQIEELFTCFQEFDIFGRGVIDAFSIKHVSSFTGREISEDEAQEIIATMVEPQDENNSTNVPIGNPTTKPVGVLDFIDFVRAMSGVTKEPLDEWDLKQVFKVFDVDDDSFISPPEMHRAFLTLGIDLTRLEINDIFREFDQDDDGLISFEEFEFLIEGAHNQITREERKKIEEFEREQLQREEEVRKREEEEEQAIQMRISQSADADPEMTSVFGGQM